MISTVTSKIISMQPNFTMSENEISQYVLHNLETVITSTISNIVSETGTSEASINRFCKKIGFKGFNKFKIALAQENFYNNMQSQVSSNDKASDSIIKSVTNDYSRMLKSTSAMIDEKDVFEAVKYISLAGNIHILALINNFVVAKELEYKLNAIGINAVSHTDVLDMLLTTTNIKSDELAIIISPSILRNDIYNSLKNCMEHGCKIITITSYDSPKLSNIDCLKFITSDNITAQNAISLSNNLMFLYVVDIIYSALLRGDKTLRRKKLNADAIINNHQMIDNYLVEY